MVIEKTEELTYKEESGRRYGHAPGKTSSCSLSIDTGALASLWANEVCVCNKQRDKNIINLHCKNTYVKSKSHGKSQTIKHGPCFSIFLHESVH